MLHERAPTTTTTTTFVYKHNERQTLHKSSFALRDVEFVQLHLRHFDACIFAMLRHIRITSQRVTTATETTTRFARATAAAAAVSNKSPSLARSCAASARQVAGAHLADCVFLPCNHRPLVKRHTDVWPSLVRSQFARDFPLTSMCVALTRRFV